MFCLLRVLYEILQLKVIRLEQSTARICAVSELSFWTVCFISKFSLEFYISSCLHEIGEENPIVYFCGGYISNAQLYFQGLSLTCTSEIYPCRSKVKKRLAEMLLILLDVAEMVHSSPLPHFFKRASGCWCGKIACCSAVLYIRVHSSSTVSDVKDVNVAEKHYKGNQWACCKRFKAWLGSRGLLD